MSADPARKVLLLEAGGSGSSPFVRVPNGIFFLKGKPSHHWLVETAPDPTRAGRRETLTCGKGLGGGSAVNGMVYVRGLAADYAHWEERAGPLWSLAAVTAAFDRAESVIGPAIPEDMHPLAAAFLESAVASGLPRLATTSIPEDPGVMACPSSAARGLRRSTAATYLKRARRRPNLTVITGAEAERLIADGRRIRAVGYRKGGRRRIAEARQEVILSCGSINTPKILMLSGIGPADHLQSHGIKVLHHSPGVGLG
ncbi:MAG TPA: GMC family oxidoreductase N-terminal domain-containing protein, partial [Sphingomonadales bacterium]